MFLWALKSSSKIEYTICSHNIDTTSDVLVVQREDNLIYPLG